MSTAAPMAGAAYRLGGRLVSAEAFYAVACDPRRSVAVEACAGAGKTWMLVSRILRALLDGAQPHEILAITFTRKAAGEMRGRLNEWLKEFAGADPAKLKKELADRGLPDASEAQVHALAGLHQKILATGRPVQIRTFHSWFAALLRAAPLAVLDELRLPVSYELLEDDAPARALVWRRFYEVLAGDDALRADFNDAVAAHGRSQTRKALEAALDKRIEFVLADARGVVDGSVRHFSGQFADFAGLAEPQDMFWGGGPSRALLADAAIALGQARAPTFAAKGAELERALSDGNAAGIFAALLTNDGTARRFGDKLAGLEQIRQAQALALRVTEARTQHEAWLHQQRMARLARVLIESFTRLKRERGWVDMNDVERASLRLLDDELLSGWIQERLDARVGHLLIDEFQDTNPLQWQALHAWLSSYTGVGAAPGVFIVGDPKQSIYRFRRAEPQVFKAAQDFIGKELGGSLLSCDHTRRNAQQVIDTVNTVMGSAVSENGYEGFRTHTTGSGGLGQSLRLPRIPRDAGEASMAGTVAADAMMAGTPGDGDGLAWRDSLTTPRELPEETLRTLEARQAARWIAQLLGHGHKPADIMILARRRASLAPMLQELRALRIPAQLGEKTALIECPEIQDVVALLDALVSPQHDLSLARALKSPLFGLTDEDLVHIALRKRDLQEADRSASWWDVLQHPQALPAHLQEPGATLSMFRAWLDSLPPHDALDAIFHAASVPARFAAAAPVVLRDTVLANLQALLSVSLQIDGARYATPYAFVRALKAGGVQAPATASRDAVQLLTVHGAKGLEAEVVLMLDTDTPPRHAETMGVLVDWPGESAWPRRFVFMASESRPSSCCADMLEAEQVARQREELNGLYVAMTRARATLAISSIEPHRASGNSWWSRMEALCSEVTVIPVTARAAAAVASGDSMQMSFQLPELPALPEPASVPQQPAPGNADAAVTDESIDTDESRVGKALHRLLQWGAADNASFSAAQVRAAVREFSLTQAQGRHACDMAQRILAGQGAWAWQAGNLVWQADEVPVIWQGKALRLDRLVRRKDNGEWWVLDYKSAARPLQKAGLLAQLQGYRAAVQAIHPGDVVKAAFLPGQGGLVQIE